MTTILNRMAEEQVYKVDEARPANAPINQYRIPTYLLEFFISLYVLGIKVNLPDNKKNSIVEIYFIINPTSLLSVGRNAKNEFLGKTITKSKLALELLSSLGIASSGSFLMSIVYRMLEEQNIYLGMDVKLEDGSVVPMFANFNSRDFGATVTALPLEEFSLWDRINRDPSRYSHTAHYVLSVSTVHKSHEKRINGDNRFCDANGIIFLEKTIEDIRYDVNSDSAEYRNGSKSVREFAVSIPAYANAVKSDLKHYVHGTVYLNRASKFGLLSLTIPDTTDKLVMRSDTFKEVCVMCHEVVSRTRNEVRIADEMTGSTILDSMSGGARFVTAAFPIDGWG